MWVHGTYHSAGITNVTMQMLDIEIINEIVWYKRNSFPNLAGRRLTASHETILWRIAAASVPTASITSTPSPEISPMTR